MSKDSQSHTPATSLEELALICSKQQEQIIFLNTKINTLKDELEEVRNVLNNKKGWTYYLPKNTKLGC